MIQEHSTIGLVITCDGSFGELQGKISLEAEETTIRELKKQGKTLPCPFELPDALQRRTQKLARELEEKYQVAVLTANCEQLRREDVCRILEKVPLRISRKRDPIFYSQMGGNASLDHEVKANILGQIMEIMKKAWPISGISAGSR